MDSNPGHASAYGEPDVEALLLLQLHKQGHEDPFTLGPARDQSWHIRGTVNRVDVVSNESQTRFGPVILGRLHLYSRSDDAVHSVVKLRLRSMLLGEASHEFAGVQLGIWTLA